jgi:hypothetical protein
MAFIYKLEHEDGTPADPRTFKTAMPNWRPGETIPLGRDRTLRSSTHVSMRERTVIPSPSSWSNRPSD